MLFLGNNFISIHPIWLNSVCILWIEEWHDTYGLTFSDLEGATSHRDYYRDDLPNPKTAEMSQITDDAAAASGGGGGTIDVVSTRGNSQQKQLSYGHQTVTYKASQNKEFLDRITSFNNPKISPHSVLGEPIQ